ncbi:Cytidylate kinase [Streptococcus sp. HSISS2]|nr:Cytidylate kinase [Streptococcus sp. HSISS2]
MKDIRIAIDGPASSGKSTVAKIIAKNLGYTYLDTGAMYRSATYLALQNGLTEDNVPEILEQLSQHPVSFGKAADGSQQVYVGDVDVTHPIRDNQVTNNVSWVAAIPEVRKESLFLNNNALLRKEPLSWTVEILVQLSYQMLNLRFS